MKGTIKTFEKRGMVCLRVRVQPRASAPAIRLTEGGIVRISVTSPPTDSRANTELLAFLAGLLGIPKSSIALLSGGRSREKTVGFSSLSSEELQKRLTQYFV